MNPVPKVTPVLAAEEGHITLAEPASARQAVSQLLASCRPTRLLIDATAIQAVSKPSHLFDFVKSLTRSLPRTAWVALVVRPDQVGHARMIERVARNAGVFLTYFIDREKAQRWVERLIFPRHSLLSPASAHTHVTTTLTTLPVETYAE